MQAKAFDSLGRLTAFTLVGAVFIFSGCAVQHDVPAQVVTAHIDANAIDANAIDEAPPSLDIQPIVPVKFETGEASFYAKRFQGHRTASGERYDMHAFTAAHRTLPFGSYARVSDLSGTRSVVVRINDRGPFEPGRAIDLSFAAASVLRLQHRGTLQVRIERVPADVARREIEANTAARVALGKHRNIHRT